MVKAILKKIPGVSAVARNLRRLGGRPDHRHDLLRSLPKHAIGAEIGVHRGDFSERILAAAKPKKLILIDPWMYVNDETYKDALYGGEKGQDQKHMDDRYNAVLARFSDKIDAGQVTVMRDLSEDALRKLDNDSLDFVYIDGNHLYEHVKKDLELSFMKVRPGGIVSGDDYAVEGWWEGGVRQAVDEFVKERKLDTLRIIGDQFLLTKPS